MKILEGEYIGENSERLSLLVKHCNNHNNADKVVFRIVYNFSTDRVESIFILCAGTSATMNDVVRELLEKHDWRVDITNISIDAYNYSKANSLGLYLQLLSEQMCH